MSLLRGRTRLSSVRERGLLYAMDIIFVFARQMVHVTLQYLGHLCDLECLINSVILLRYLLLSILLHSSSQMKNEYVWTLNKWIVIRWASRFWYFGLLSFIPREYPIIWWGGQLSLVPSILRGHGAFHIFGVDFFMYPTMYTWCVCVLLQNDECPHVIC